MASHAECFAPALPRAVAQRELDHLGQALGWSGEQLQVAAVRQNEGPGNALLATLAYEHLCEVFTQFGMKGVSAEKVAHDLAREVRRHQAAGPRWARTWPTNGPCRWRWPSGAAGAVPATPARN